MSVIYKHEDRKYHPVEDKVVVIAGASSGIGAGIAIHFSQLGYKKLVLVRIYSAILLLWKSLHA